MPMARTLERRTTTSRTVRTTKAEGADQIKANLSNIATEIARVRDQAREEVNALDKIRGMLDAGYLTDLLRSIEELEVRIEELEDTSLNAQGDLERTQRDLEQEQERLAKLWDAYKAQEDELERLKRDYPLMEEKLFERERTIETMRREMTRLESASRFEKDARRLEDENRKLVQQLRAVEGELESVNAHVAELEEEAGHLREEAAGSQRVRELEDLLEEERERLAKLYKVYEDVEAEKNNAAALLEEWRAWYKRVAPAMESVGQAPGSAPARRQN